MKARAKEWTVMLYLGALDKGQAEADAHVLKLLGELKCPMRDVECIYLLALEDGTEIGRVTGAPGREILAKNPPIDLTDPDEITKFVDWATRRYPSRYTALFLKDHGTGIHARPPPEIRAHAIFVDGKHSMPVTKLRTAIENTACGYVDLYGLDACQMAAVELAYELRDVTSFFIATKVVESNVGWNYQNIVGHLELHEESLGPRELVPFVVGQSEIATEHNTIGVEVSWMQALSGAVDALAQALNPRAGDFAAWAVETFGTQHEAVDLHSLVERMLASPMWQGLAALQGVKAALAHATVAGAGLTLFLPLGGSAAFGTYGALEFAQENFWARFIGAVNQQLL